MNNKITELNHLQVELMLLEFKYCDYINSISDSQFQILSKRIKELRSTIQELNNHSTTTHSLAISHNQ